MPLSDPANGAWEVTTSDTESLPGIARGLYIGSDGDVSVFLEDRTSAVFHGARAGTVLPVCVRRVNATGTTATNIVALK